MDVKNIDGLPLSALAQTDLAILELEYLAAQGASATSEWTSGSDAVDLKGKSCVSLWPLRQQQHVPTSLSAARYVAAAPAKVSLAISVNKVLCPKSIDPLCLC